MNFGQPQACIRYESFSDVDLTRLFVIVSVFLVFEVILMSCSIMRYNPFSVVSTFLTPLKLSSISIYLLWVDRNLSYASIKFCLDRMLSFPSILGAPSLPRFLLVVMVIVSSITILGVITISVLVLLVLLHGWLIVAFSLFSVDKLSKICSKIIGGTFA